MKTLLSTLTLLLSLNVGANNYTKTRHKVKINNNLIPFSCEKVTEDDQKFLDICEEQLDIVNNNEIIQKMISKLNIPEINLVIYDYHNFPKNIDFGQYEKNGKPYFIFSGFDLGYDYHSIRGDLERYEIYYNQYKNYQTYGAGIINCENVSDSQCESGKKRLKGFKNLVEDNIDEVILLDNESFEFPKNDKKPLPDSS